MTKKISAPSVILTLIVFAIAAVWIGKGCNNDIPETTIHQDVEKKSKENWHDDSIAQIAKAVSERKQIIEDSLDFIKQNPRAGKIWHRHPDWDMIDCENVAKGEIWIGMTYEMLIEERGKPNIVNPSNYGQGEQYQVGWYDYHPMFFYFKEDHIIYAYN